MRSIRKGGEPFYFPGNSPGMLLIHGFTAAPQEIRLLGSDLNSRGYATLGVRLFAHASKRKDVLRARFQDWIASVEDGYHLLSDRCSSIVLIGLSLGGALALHAAGRLPCTAVIAMSTPNRMPPSPMYKRMRPILRPLSALIKFRPKKISPWRDMQARNERVQYDFYPLRSLLELETMLDEMRNRLPHIQVPTLLIHSRTDAAVPVEHMDANFSLIGSQDKRRVWIEESDHIITADHARQEVFDAIGKFLQQVVE
ncbi:MAG: alpha/beta fold hydrolase [Chloroflexi bacterium]|nr:alpha/beta fold hydrolase [Chloroflexota bacterium]